LQQQVKLFDSVSRSYERLRSKAGVNHGPLGKLTRAPVIAGALLVLVAGAYLVWKRRRRSLAEKSRDGAPEKLNPKIETATALYRSLETALALQGITRPASLPPLRHAEDLRARKHPLASEVLALTGVYLEARFGGGALTDRVRRDFERRVREIREFRAARAVTADA
jgi:hypothetical protein